MHCHTTIRKNHLSQWKRSQSNLDLIQQLLKSNSSELISFVDKTIDEVSVLLLNLLDDLKLADQVCKKRTQVVGEKKIDAS